MPHRIKMIIYLSALKGALLYRCDILKSRLSLKKPTSAVFILLNYKDMQREKKKLKLGYLNKQGKNKIAG